MRVDVEGFVLAGEEVTVTGSAVAVTPISFPTYLQHYPRCSKLGDDEHSLSVIVVELTFLMTFAIPVVIMSTSYSCFGTIFLEMAHFLTGETPGSVLKSEILTKATSWSLWYVEAAVPVVCDSRADVLRTRRFHSRRLFRRFTR